LVSVSVERARRAETPKLVSMARVATAVMTGKCQNNQTMVAADKAQIAKSAAMLLRACVASVMPVPPDVQSYRATIQVLLLNDHIVIG
jgi:hypothetical protein